MGYAPNIKAVNHVSASVGAQVDFAEDFTGQKAHLYESDDRHSNGFQDRSGIHVRVNGSKPVVWIFGHEYAHFNKLIQRAAGNVLKRMEGVVKNYAQWRGENIANDRGTRRSS